MRDWSEHPAVEDLLLAILGTKGHAKKTESGGDLLGDMMGAGMKVKHKKLEHPLDAYAPPGVQMDDMQRAQINSLLRQVGVKKNGRR